MKRPFGAKPVGCCTHLKNWTAANRRSGRALFGSKLGSENSTKLQHGGSKYVAERDRSTALLPLWLLWLLRTTASPAVSSRVERLRLGEQLLLRVRLARNGSVTRGRYR